MDVPVEYAKAYVEVLEVIKYLKKDEYERIPKEKIELYEEYKDKSYSFKFDNTKPINKQVSFEAENVLANLFLKYISTKEDREKFYEDERKRWYENEKKKPKYEVKFDNNFAKNENKIDEKSSTKEESSEIIEVTNKSFFTKIIEKIRNFFIKK